MGKAGKTVTTEAAKRLLRWYERRKRDLPWRRTRDPYAIWLSEIMLQQTRVDVVVPYYERFLERFPTVEALARAEESEVLTLWSGLGYYRRARLLHRAARELCASGGALPRRFTDWKRLPGVGDYTAAAVSSIAYGEVEPVLDGNVERFLARRHRLEGPLRTAARKRELRELARAYLAPQRPGDSNQAMMELGATICRPRSPRCDQCPEAADCQAHAVGEEEAYPQSDTRRRTVREDRVAALVERDGCFLLFRRDDGAELLAGTWEIPWCKVEPSEKRSQDRLSATYGGLWRLGESLGTVRHAITFRDLRYEVRVARLSLGPEGHGDEVGEGPEAAWVSEADLDGLPIGSLVRKIVACRETSR